MRNVKNDAKSVKDLARWEIMFNFVSADLLAEASIRGQSVWVCVSVHLMCAYKYMLWKRLLDALS